MNRRRWIGIVACVLALSSGCGKNRVVLDIDVLSFMDPADTARDYDAPPATPLAARVDPIEVQLLEGYDDLGQAREATLDVGVRYDNASGSGSGRILVYFGADAAGVYDTLPVAIVDAELSAGVVTLGEVHIQADERILGLFTSRSFYMGLDLEWTPQSGDPLQGTCTLTQIRARVVSELDLL